MFIYILWALLTAGFVNVRFRPPLKGFCIALIVFRPIKRTKNLMMVSCMIHIFASPPLNNIFCFWHLFLGIEADPPCLPTMTNLEFFRLMLNGVPPREPKVADPLQMRYLQKQFCLLIKRGRLHPDPLPDVVMNTNRGDNAEPS